RLPLQMPSAWQVAPGGRWRKQGGTGTKAPGDGWGALGNAPLEPSKDLWKFKPEASVAFPSALLRSRDLRDGENRDLGLGVCWFSRPLSQPYRVSTSQRRDGHAPPHHRWGGCPGQRGGPTGRVRPCPPAVHSLRTRRSPSSYLAGAR